MKKVSTSFLILVLAQVGFNSCKKEFDVPPLNPPGAAYPITIAEIKAKFDPSNNYRFGKDNSLYCMVIADEQSGNLYKEAYIRDKTGALHIKLTNSGGLYVGDSIRINIKGCILNHYNNLIQLDSVDVVNNIVKIASGYQPKPEVMSIEQINANTVASNIVQSSLVKINGVEFIASDQNVTYADATSKKTLNRIIKSCNGQTLTVRTSGYSNFAGNTTPEGNGSIIGIVSQFGNIMQLTLRNVNEVKMDSAGCSTAQGQYLYKDFNNNSITSGGWSEQLVSGSIGWVISTYGGKTFGKISNYTGGANQPCETWLISPPIDLSNASSPKLSFLNAYNYQGAPLKLYISADYTSGAPSSGNWVELPFNLSSGNFEFVSSGAIDVSSFKTTKTRIAFQYVGSNTNGSTWEIDDVIITE